MTILSNKKNKPINVNSRAFKNAQIKSRQSVKKTNNLKIKLRLKSCWTWLEHGTKISANKFYHVSELGNIYILNCSFGDCGSIAS